MLHGRSCGSLTRLHERQWRVIVVLFAAVAFTFFCCFLGSRCYCELSDGACCLLLLCLGSGQLVLRRDPHALQLAVLVALFLHGLGADFHGQGEQQEHGRVRRRG